MEASTKIEGEEEPENFDFEDFFASVGCEARFSTILADYLVCACGRGFAREVGMDLSDTYKRRLSNGSWSPEIRYDDDPVWLVVEEFVESIRLNQNSRRQFSLIAKHSAEVDAVNVALNDGKMLDDLKGASFSGAFNKPL